MNADPLRPPETDEEPWPVPDDDLAPARAAPLAELEAGVEGLRDSEWRECGGACHDYTIAAVLDLIRTQGTAKEPQTLADEP